MSRQPRCDFPRPTAPPPDPRYSPRLTRSCAMKTQGANQDVAFLSRVPTGFGAYGASLKDLSATELGAAAARTALARSRLPAGVYGHTVLRSSLQTSAGA